MDFTRTGPFAALRHLIYSMRHRGLRQTCLLGFQEWRKERELGIRTFGMSSPCSDAGPGAHIYQPSSSVLFAKAMQQLDIPLQGMHLFDVGCGKGRALVLAAEAGFTKITGIDLDPVLCNDARDNIKRVKHRYPATAFTVLQADAIAFGVPEDVDVAYLFNPFGKDLLSQWLQNMTNTRTLPLHIVYMHPVHKDVMTEARLRLIHDDPCGEFSIFTFKK
jgi:SAM-dependent methyltransferase